MGPLERQLVLIGARIHEISKEIEHARKQELSVKQSGGAGV
jgi:hypothetical protein